MIAVLVACAESSWSPDTGSARVDPAALHACDDFCSLYLDTCAFWGGWTDATDCVVECRSWAQGTPGATGGDSLECRYWHLEHASVDPATHCPHAAADSEPCSGDPQ